MPYCSSHYTEFMRCFVFIITTLTSWFACLCFVSVFSVFVFRGNSAKVKWNGMAWNENSANSATIITKNSNQKEARYSNWFTCHNFSTSQCFAYKFVSQSSYSSENTPLSVFIDCKLISIWNFKISWINWFMSISDEKCEPFVSSLPIT